MKDKPEIRNMLVISTAHVPDELRVLASEHEDTSEWNTVVHVLDVGFLLWVPNDPKESSEEGQEDDTHPAILAIQLHARALNCDYVLIDRDAPIVAELPTFDEEDEDEDEKCEKCNAALVDGSCPACGIYHDPGNACPACGAAGWHKPSCPTLQDADDASMEELEAASAILQRERVCACGAPEVVPPWDVCGSCLDLQSERKSERAR